MVDSEPESQLLGKEVSYAATPAADPWFAWRRPDSGMEFTFNQQINCSHPNTHQVVFVCNLCSITYSDKDQLKNHLKEHEEDLISVRCVACKSDVANKHEKDDELSDVKDKRGKVRLRPLTEILKEEVLNEMQVSSEPEVEIISETRRTADHSRLSSLTHTPAERKKRVISTATDPFQFQVEESAPNGKVVLKFHRGSFDVKFKDICEFLKSKGVKFESACPGSTSLQGLMTFSSMADANVCKGKAFKIKDSTIRFALVPARKQEDWKPPGSHNNNLLECGNEQTENEPIETTDESSTAFI